MWSIGRDVVVVVVLFVFVLFGMCFIGVFVIIVVVDSGVFVWEQVNCSNVWSDG